jgi:predicted DNA binding CopG/RHH family protein
MKKVPKLTTEEEAEAFLEQDLSDLDFSDSSRYTLSSRRKRPD